MLLARLVETAEQVAATSSRNLKVAKLADLLRQLDPEEVPVAVGLLAGDPRQGRIGIGWASLYSVQVTNADAPSLQILELDTVMTLIEKTTGGGSVEARGNLLADLLHRATPSEAEFVKRLFVGELRQGALEGLMVDAIARASTTTAAGVRRALMLNGDVRETAVVALQDGQLGLERVGLHPLRPLKPMLASTSNTIAEALGDSESSVEWKVDGIRIQVHKSKGEIRVFTRNLNDITDRVQRLAAIAQQLPADTFVLDGEALGATAYFFDCLHLDGEDLIDEPLLRRIEALDRLVGALRIPSIVTSEAEAAEQFLESALKAGHEGVVVKALHSTYQAGRRGKSWRKVKPSKTLDLVILAAEWGHGRRRGWLSNLHLGARDPSGGFVMIGKTFKGLTDEMLGWQTEQLSKLETSRAGITVYVQPRIVVEIELDGVLASTRYPGGVGLRFARVKRYRPDKDASDIDTIESVRRLLP